MAIKKLEIELLYLDLVACGRCQGTHRNMEEAITEVSQILKATGVEVEVKKIHVQTEKQARQLGFISSPTIRINGQDIQMDVKESLCQSCGDLCGEDVDCRIWTYHGKEYTVAPKAMIIDAILREVYGVSKEEMQPKERTGDIPENLKRFFAAKQKKETGQRQREGQAAGCCSSADSAGCCS